MTNFSINPKLIAMIAITTVYAGSASAATGGEWKRSAMENGSKNSEYIYSTAAESSTIAFTCINGKFRAVIATDPQDLSSLYDKDKLSKRFSKRFASLNVNGTKNNTQPWGISRTRGLAVSQTSKPAVELYNAVVRGQSVMWDRSGKDPVELTVPEVNGEFAKFGAGCGIGSEK